MNPREAPEPRQTDLEGQVDAVMDAARVLVALVGRTVAEVSGIVTPPQLRILVMVRSHGPLNLLTVAEALAVHPSNATRACDRLVSLRLLERRESATDRRQLAITLTADGQRLVDLVMRHRREAISRVVRRMTPPERDDLATAMAAYAAAADEASGEAPVGWNT